MRWYVAYPLSLRHLEEMMVERGVAVDHSTIVVESVQNLGGDGWQCRLVLDDPDEMTRISTVRSEVLTGKIDGP